MDVIILSINSQAFSANYFLSKINFSEKFAVAVLYMKR